MYSVVKFFVVIQKKKNIFIHKTGGFYWQFQLNLTSWKLSEGGIELKVQRI